MLRKFRFNFIYFFLCSAFILIQFHCTSENKKNAMTQDELIAKGKYLVNAGGCNDCHSPKILTQMGPMIDTTRLLSGHPAQSILPKYSPDWVKPGNWMLTSGDATAWVGPWGVSFTANLSPDNETGIGNWTEEVFINALRTGKHMGVGRPILPPMPWESVGKMTDEDLKAIFAYLKSLPPVKNKVPDPILAGMMNESKDGMEKKGNKDVHTMKKSTNVDPD